ncbi:MAG: YciI family protein [Minicystis sp.]
MRFMVLMYPGPEAETRAPGDSPADTKILEEMGRFNEELVKAGVMLAGEGLHPTAKGARVRWPEGKPVVTDGPFTETKEIIGGFWLWQVKSKEEALEWIKRCPVSPGQMIELRRVYEAEDFGADFTPELRAQEDRLREEMANRS